MVPGKPLKAIVMIVWLFKLQLALAQNQIVTGKIIDSKDKSPISNVSVVAKGANIGTQTDSNGNFRLSVSLSVHTLTISATGFLTQDIDVGVNNYIEVALVSTASSLDDVVVIGYGTTKKKDLTGAVASVSEKDFNKGIFSSPDQLIMGKVSGVQMITNNGEPGGAITVKIRGNSALSGTGQPLFVVDGIPLDGRSLQAGNNPLNFLNSADIASIDVLKDASATAIYGSRAAYGVVIINTKKGQKGATRLDVAISTGVSSILKKIRVLNAAEYRDAIKYYGVANSFDKGGNVDGLQSILQDALQQNYSIAGSSGNENGSYRFSAGFLNQEGIVINTGFKKYNAGISSNFKFLDSKKLGLDIHLNSSQYIQDGSFLSSGNDRIIQTALQWNPTDSLRNKDGSVKITPGDNVNPIALSELARDNLKVTTILGSLSPYYKFSDWLEYKLLVSINYSSGISRSSFNQALGVYGGIFPSGGIASINNYELITEQITHTVNLNKEIFQDLYLNAVAGYEYMKFTSKGFSLSGYGDSIGFGSYGLNYTNYLQYSDPGSRTIASYIDPLSELQAFFGRAIFNFKDKYLLTSTFRADGSTKFGANNKYGYFPSFAMAWNISKEKFFKVGLIDLLKIRAGWGRTGNQEFPPGSSQALYALQSGGSIIQLNNPNPDLKWQSDRQYNIGIDFSIFNNQVSGTMDYFNKITTSLLFPSPPIQPAPPNSTVRWKNLNGEILNKGLEVFINAAIIRNEKFSWDLSVSATFLKNNLSGLPTSVFTAFVSGASVETIQNGLPMDAFYTRKFLGLDKSTGFSVYQDDGSTFYYEGNPNPKTLLDMGSTFSYKKFSFIANMTGSFGQHIYNSTLMELLNVGSINGGANMALSVYQDPVKESFGNPVTPSSRYIQKGNYLKMTCLTISYNIGDVAKTFRGTNLYVTAQNLFIITRYPGFDPEVNVDSSVNNIPSLGIDYARYPSSRSIILGINFYL